MRPFRTGVLRPPGMAPGAPRRNVVVLLVYLLVVLLSASYLLRLF